MLERPADVPADYVHCDKCDPPCWHHATYHERDPRIGTHWVGCWRSHHGCATAIIEQVLDGAIDEGIRRLHQSDGSEP